MTCKAERDVVRLIQNFDLLSADCKHLEKEAADEAAIGVVKAAPQNASVPPAVPATGMPKAMMLLIALSGEARDMVSSFPAESYDRAMEQLTAKFRDSFQQQEVKLEPQRSRSFEWRQPWLETWS